MKSYLFFLVLLITLLFPYSSFAAFSGINGATLLELCNASIKSFENKLTGTSFKQGVDSGMCVGYLAGIEDMYSFSRMSLSVIKQLNKNPDNKNRLDLLDLLYCLPGKLTSEQLVKVVVTYLKAHPESHSKPAYLAVIQAYALSFPCPKDL